MSKKSRISFEIKIKYVQNYLAGKISIFDVCKELNITRWAFYLWITKYDSSGAEGLCQTSQNTKYPKEIKNFVVEDYLLGRGTLLDICKKYNISSDSVLRRWIKMYNNSHKQYKTLNVKENKFMTKGRKTTYDERIEIVAFCIENNDNYQLTSDKYKVSYQQVYSWVRKYKANGQDSLIDNRGKSKTFNEMSDSQRLMAQIKLLEAQNKRLEMENDFLKKLEEIERRR